MGFPRHLLLLLLVLLLPFTNCEKLDKTRCKKSSHHQNVLSNTDKVVIMLAKMTTMAGFSHFSYGVGAEAVHGLAWCRAELSSLDCSNCLSKASRNIRRKCPRSIAARSWFDDFCYLRYDTDNFVGKLDTSLVNIGKSQQRVKNPKHRSSFVVTVNHVLNVLKLSAMAENEKIVTARRWFYEENSTVYGEAQCARDLTAKDCSSCLANQLPVFHHDCEYRRSCEVLFGSCFMRYYTKRDTVV